MRMNLKMVGGTGIEPVTPCVSSKCSTAELTAHSGLAVWGLIALSLGLCKLEMLFFMRRAGC